MRNVHDYAFFWSSELLANNVYTTMIATAEICRPDEATLISVTQMPHRWHHVFLVKCQDQAGQFYVKSMECRVNRNCRTEKLQKQLKKRMQELKDSCNVSHIKSYGWVATTHEIDTMQAMRQIGWLEGDWKQTRLWEAA